jgi:hypothetical protein
MAKRMMNIGDDLMMSAPLLFQRSNHGIALARPKKSSAARPTAETGFLGSREFPLLIDI